MHYAIARAVASMRAGWAMSAGRAMPRLFVDGPLSAGGRLELSRAQAHYVRDVMRRAPGDSVLLFNGRDGEWRAAIEIDRRGCAATAVEQTRPQAPEPDLWLVFAPVKRAPLDLVAGKATELGVSALWPVFTRRTAVGRVNLARLRANCIEAAEQCRRLTAPDCFAPVRLEEALADWPDERRIVLCDESGAGQPVAGALAAAGAGAGRPWAVITGPEGGFDPAEAAALAALPGVVRVSLGPRILRAETAAIAALACFQALMGDWR